MIATANHKARDDAFYRELGARIRDARLNRGISQEELAAVVGIERVALSRYEHGHRAIPLPTLVRVAAHLKRPLTDLLPSVAGAELPPTPPPPSPRLADLAELIAEIERHPELIPRIRGFLAALRAGDDEPI